MTRSFEYLQMDCIGIAIPGLVDSDSVMWVYSCFSGIRDFDIAHILNKELGFPVFIENDINICAYSEKIFGSCKSTNNFMWITVSNGIGGGLILNGDIYTGAFNNAGEIGHVNLM